VLKVSRVRKDAKVLKAHRGQ